MPPFFYAAAAADPLLPVLALTLLLTVGTALLLKKMRLPALPGYFLCGFLLARTPLLDLSQGSEGASMLTKLGDVGVVLLMFSIGTECSLHELKQLRKNGLAAGLWQMVLTWAVFSAVAFFMFDQGWISLLWGVIAAVSSTAVGLKMFEEAGDAGQGGARLALGIALVQDILVILLLLLPALATGTGLEGAAKATGWLALEGIAFVTAAVLLSRWGIPQMLKAVSKTRARDLFTLTVLALCAGIASLAQLFGLGVTIGAFAAGVAVSGSVYSHRILADAAPFRDFFLTVFFLSVGALVDPKYFMDHWLLIIGASVIVLIVKTSLTIIGAGHFTRAPMSAAVLAAAALSGIGEFAVVVAREAASRDLLRQDDVQLVLAVAALTLSLSPFFLRPMVAVAEKLDARRLAASKPGKTSAAQFSKRVKELEDHAILCGYGTVGQILHKGLTRLGIPVVIIELNAETVAALLKKGHPVLFADIAQADTLQLAGVSRARMIIVSFPQAEIARAAITIAREHNPGILTLCRARFPHEVTMLRALAPDNVVHDEMEAGIKMLRLCARGYERDEGDLFPGISV